MLHNRESALASIDKQLARAKFKPWYDENEVTPDELLDKRLDLMRAGGWTAPEPEAKEYDGAAAHA